MQSLFWAAFFYLPAKIMQQKLISWLAKKLGVEEAVKVDINYTLSGKAKAKLSSPLMLRVQDTMPYVEFPKNIHVDFYNETAKIESSTGCQICQVC